jgi:hypothetical protein
MSLLGKQDFRVMEPLRLKIRCQEKMAIEKSLVKVVLEEIDELSWRAMKHVLLPHLRVLIQNREMKQGNRRKKILKDRIDHCHSQSLH